jgi:hypothetical protein
MTSDAERLAAAKKVLAEDQARRERNARRGPMGPPTPSQAENDRAARGEHVLTREERRR